jgi:hypothetical protein
MKSSHLFSFFRLSPFAFFLVSCSYLPEKQELPSVITVYDYREYIEINPTSNHYAKTGLVFYPGGLVDPRAYIEPLTQFALSGKGHKVVIVKMPANLAVLDGNQGAWIFNDFPGVRQWVIAGHSLGGVMACGTVEKYPDFFKGIILMAAYPQSSTNLSEWNGAVLSLRGQFDGLVDSLTIASGQELLPTPFWVTGPSQIPDDQKPMTVYYTIPGGNHAMFGKCGEQKGDGAATRSRVELTSDITLMILRFFILNGWEYEID